MDYVGVDQMTSRRMDSKGSGAFVGVDRDLRVVYLEDDDNDFELTKRLLVHHNISVYRLRSIKELLAYVRAPGVKFDMIIADLSLIDSMGIETIQKVRDLLPCLPVIVVSGIYDERLAQEIFNLGAHDYLVKGDSQNEVLIRSVKNALMRDKKNNSGTKRAVKKISELRQQLRDLPDGYVS